MQKCQPLSFTYKYNDIIFYKKNYYRIFDINERTFDYVVESLFNKERLLFININSIDFYGEYVYWIRLFIVLFNEKLNDYWSRFYWVDWEFWKKNK